MNSRNVSTRRGGPGSQPQARPSLSPVISRVIFALVSAIGVLVGIEYNSMRSDALATAQDVAALRQKMAQMEAYESTAVEHARQDDEILSEVERRLEAIDGRLTTIGEEVAVLADRATRADAPHQRSARVRPPADVLPDPPRRDRGRF
jgi:hypothetical protein